MNTKYHDLIFLNRPDKIYVPIDNNKDYTIVPKIGEYIYKASPIAHTKGEIKEEVYAPLSGKYLEMNKGDNYKYLVIENDYKEMNEDLKGINKFIDKMSYEDFIKKVQESGISDNNISIYNKYLDSHKKSILIDCFDNSLIYSKYILENNLDELLEIIDAIYEINKLNKCFIVINKKDKKLRKLLEQRIGTYLHLKIINLSDKKNINKIQYIAKKNKINADDIIVENIKNILALRNVLKYNIPLIEKHIIISFNKNYIPIKVKIGTKISYILSNLGIEASKYILKTYDNNIEIDNQDIVIDSNINEIII